MGGSSSSKLAEQHHAVVFKTFDFEWDFCAKKFFDAESPQPDNKSPSFEQPIVQYDWYVKIERDSSPDAIQIWLCLQDSPKKPVLVEFALALKGVENTKPMSEVKGSHVFVNTPAQSEKCVLIRNDKELPLRKLRIHVRIDAEIMRKDVSTQDVISNFRGPHMQDESSEESQDVPSEPKPANKFSSDLHCLLKTGMHSDIQINVQGLVIDAHGCLLACRSPVFSAMLSHDMSESKDKMIIIKDFNPEIFFEFLVFIYSGLEPEFTFTSAVELLRASNKYDVIDLKALCEAYLTESIGEDNAFALLQHASDFNAADLKENVLNYIVKYIRVFKTCEEYTALPKLLLTEILVKLASAQAGSEKLK